MQKEYDEYNFMYDKDARPVYYEKKHYLDVMPGFEDIMPKVCITVRLDRIRPDDTIVLQEIFSEASRAYRAILARRLKKSGRFK